MAFESMFPLLVRDKLGMGGEGVAYLMMGVGGGALVCILSLASVRSELVRGRLLLVLGVASGLTPLTLGLAPNLPLMVMAAAGMGASQAAYMTIFHTVVQSIVPDSIRGRISALSNMYIAGFMATFNLVTGFLAEFYLPGWILGTTGAAFVLVVALSFLSVPLRRLYKEGVPAMAAAQAVA